MPRRNLYLLLAICLISAVCFRKADSAHRSRYGRMFHTFVQILEEVEGQYVEPIDDRLMFEGALDGMVNQLDENSNYLSPAEMTRQRQSLEQKFGGIGIEVTFDRDTNALTVVTPLVGSPAFEAGVLPGDTIVTIEGESTERMSFEDVLRRLRGKVDDPVRLQIVHIGESDPVEVSIRRREIKVDSVLGDHRRADGSWDYLLPGDDHFGYIAVSNFGKETVKEFEAALTQVREQGARAVVLDLRNNGGGLLDAAVSVCSLFVPSGRIVTVRGRDKVELNARDASGKAPFADLPLVVLINNRSASASEIVAACLQDYHLATIVGQRSYGKGTVQEILPLEEGRSGLKLTIATYWRPSDQNIHRGLKAKETDEWGVHPDAGFEVKLSLDQLRELNRTRRERDLALALKNRGAGQGTEPLKTLPAVVDPQLDKAIEATRQRLADAAKATAA